MRGSFFLKQYNMNKKILLIDDDEDEQSIFAEAIHAAKISFDCVFANSAAQGIKIIDSVLPDYIFVDFNMPAKNGIECIKEIKEKNSFKETPVILYTTGLDDRLANTAMQFGASACIKKPFSISALAEMLKNILIPNANSVY